MELKLPPHDRIAEQAVVGSVMMDPGILPKVKQRISPDDFYMEKFRLIYKAILELEEITPVTIEHEMTKKGTFESAGGFRTLADIVRQATAVGWESHIEIVKDLSVKRQLIAEYQTSTERLYKLEDTAPILSDHKQRLREIESRGAQKQEEPFELVKDRYEYYMARQKGDISAGPPFGFRLIDDVWGGFEIQTYYLKAARQAGKSQLALQIADNVAEYDTEKQVLFYTLESSRQTLMDRRISRYSRIPLSRLRNGNIHDEYENQNLHAALDAVPYNLWLFDDYRLQRWSYLESHTETMALEYDLSLIVIDFLQLLTAELGGMKKHDYMGELSNRLNALTKRHQVPILIITQINTDGDAKESGDIENNAGYVLYLQREQHDAEARLTATKAKDQPTFDGRLSCNRYIMTWADVSNTSPPPVGMGRKDWF